MYLLQGDLTAIAVNYWEKILICSKVLGFIGKILLQNKTDGNACTIRSISNNPETVAPFIPKKR